METEKNKVQKQMYIIAASCWNCRELLNVAVIKGDVKINHGQVYGPESFSEEEIRMAESHDVMIKMQHSGTRQESYNANTCPSCDTFVGQHYLFTEYFCSAQYGDYTYKTIDMDS